MNGSSSYKLHPGLPTSRQPWSWKIAGKWGVTNSWLTVFCCTARPCLVEGTGSPPGTDSSRKSSARWTSPTHRESCSCMQRRRRSRAQRTKCEPGIILYKSILDNKENPVTRQLVITFILFVRGSFLFGRLHPFSNCDVRFIGKNVSFVRAHGGLAGRAVLFARALALFCERVRAGNVATFRWGIIKQDCGNITYINF